MKTKLLISCLIFANIVFGQTNWEIIYNQDGNAGLNINNLSSDGAEHDVFVCGNRKNSFTAHHVSKINQWTKDQKWAQNFLSLSINAQDDPKDVFVLGKDVWVCGNRGMISHSSDHGYEGTWNLQQTPVNNLFLESIWFTDENNGWAVGRNAAILYTKNGGSTWNTYKSPVNVFFSRVFFTDNSNGYILGMQRDANNSGVVLKTTNAGKSWAIHNFKTNAQIISGMYFYDSQNGWICGDGGFISHTIDGGISWEKQQWANKGGNYNLFDIHFVSRNEGWACGSKGLLYHTIDGGNNWQRIDIGEVQDFKTIEFNGPYIGWVATSRKVYQLMDSRFKKYKQEYSKKVTTNTSSSGIKQPAQTSKPKDKLSQVLIGATTAVAFLSIEKGDDWEIRSYENDLTELNKAFTQIQKEGFMSVGLNIVNNKMEVFVINSQPFKCSDWTLKKYGNNNDLSTGISKMIESGFLPFGMTLVENNFNILFARTSYIGHAWQIVESELDHQVVASDIQPHLADGYIPVGISLFTGYFYTLLIQPNEFPVSNYSIRGYDATQSSQLKTGIAGEKNNGFLPQGYFKEEGIINILYNRF